MKKSKIFLITIFILSFFTILFIDNYFYAGVINLTVSVVILILFIVCIKKCYNQKNIFLTFSIFIMSFIIICLLSFPNYNYSQASQLVLDKYQGKLINSTNKNIAIYRQGFNFVNPNRHYLITLEYNGETTKYRVNPNTGDIFLEN